MASQPGGPPNPVLYNEGVLRGLDYVLAQAQLRGIRVILVRLPPGWRGVLQCSGGGGSSCWGTPEAALVLPSAAWGCSTGWQAGPLPSQPPLTHTPV